jgi:hypothetical protein
MKIDRSLFFPRARSSVFRGSMTQTQVNGINALLDMCEQLSVSDPRYVAYILATAFHETAQTMEPIAEYGKGRGKLYGRPGVDGQIAYGRGYVQTTWAYNYEKTDQKLGLGGRLIANYDLLLTDKDMAAKAAITGMRDGWYTGKKLADYLTPHITDFLDARRIINGMDCAALIAGYARNFLASIGTLQ